MNNYEDGSVNFRGQLCGNLLERFYSARRSADYNDIAHVYGSTTYDSRPEK
jgi:hypothetical protein